MGAELGGGGAGEAPRSQQANRVRREVMQGQSPCSFLGGQPSQCKGLPSWTLSHSPLWEANSTKSEAQFSAEPNLHA